MAFEFGFDLRKCSNPREIVQCAFDQFGHPGDRWKLDDLTNISFKNEMDLTYILLFVSFKEDDSINFYCPYIPRL